MALKDNLNSIGALGSWQSGISPINAQGLLGRQHDYFSAETALFIKDAAQYASDYYECDCQGILEDDFFAYVHTTIRLADIAERGTGSNLMENWKIAFFDDPKIQFVGVGAKCVVGRQTYLVTNPMNANGGATGVIMRRCNALWGYLDYYGNAKYEPFVWNKDKAEATANAYSQIIVNTNAYQHSLMQRNENTWFIRENTRVILGQVAFAVRGMVDFTQEFTDDLGSANMLSFDLFQQEPDFAQDDMERRIAGGLVTGWVIEIDGQETIGVGAGAQMRASAYKFGEEPTQPYSFVWASSDESVATVNPMGIVTAVGEGEAEITVALAENEQMKATMSVKVLATMPDGIEWITPPPAQLHALSTVAAQASFFEQGRETANEIKYSLSNALSGSYSTVQNGNQLYITCYQPSASPLKIVASYQDYSAEAEIELLR